MNLKLKRWQKASAAAVVAGIALGLSFPVLSAVGQASPPQAAVQVGSTATLLAKGVGVDVPVTVTCPSNGFFFPTDVSVSLSEKSGKTIVQNNSGAQVMCTGAPQTIVVTVFANGKPFKVGTALATASLQAFCNTGPCFATDSRAIKITNK